MMKRSQMIILVLANTALAITINKHEPFQQAVHPNSALEGTQKTYAFDDFVKKFNRQYQEGSTEWMKRQEIFNTNMNMILMHNTHPTGMSWSLGVNHFMDRTDSEKKRMLGYKRQKQHHSFLDLGQKAPNSPEPLAAEPLMMPEHHDWRPQLITKHLTHDQGSCGSCWAAAAVSTLEHHLGLKHNVSVKLSMQSLVSCSPNIHHCGGQGGCEGSTAELAFEYIAKSGIPAESNYPYFASDDACSKNVDKLTHVLIADYVKLPENEGRPLMQAVLTQGPIAISVYASEWFLYSGGIFSGCKKDATINHAVVLMGFGKDDVKGQSTKYWLVQNSWGTEWGEEGTIRLLRHDHDDEYCGTDYAPEDGTGCDGGPATVKVCGMCGMLYDSCYPTSPNFKHQSEGGTFIDQFSEPLKIP